MVSRIYDDLKANLLALPRPDVYPGQALVWTVGADVALGPYPLSSLVYGGLAQEPTIGREERAGDVSQVQSDFREASAHAELGGGLLSAWLPWFRGAKGNAKSTANGRFSYRFLDVKRRSVNVLELRDIVRGKSLNTESLAAGPSGAALRYFVISETLSSEDIEMRWQDDAARNLSAEAALTEVAKLGASRNSRGDDEGSVVVKGRGRVVFGVRLLELSTTGGALTLKLEHSRLGVLGPDGVDQRDFVVSSYAPIAFGEAAAGAA
jgi:hypothetical protein